jgi:hypothetical protein
MSSIIYLLIGLAVGLTVVIMSCLIMARKSEVEETAVSGFDPVEEKVPASENFSEVDTINKNL